jgi:hypothetical protein
MKKLLMFIIFLIFISILASCSSSIFSDDSPETENKDGKTFIIDKTGKRWDISHAIHKYNMEAKRFQFGLGPFAIRPIQKPNFLYKDDPGYPNSNADFLVIGFSLEKDTRAYPIDILSLHEIVDDKFGDTHVAVAY